MHAQEELANGRAIFIGENRLFVSTTGKLLTGYVNCEVIYPFWASTRELTKQLVEPFLDQVDCFACPATGDIVLLQHATAIANEHGFATTAVWADKQDDNSYVIERVGFAELVPGARVLILNDRISQGGTTRKMIHEVRRLGGHIIGVATLAGVSHLSAEALGVPRLHALCNVDVQAYEPAELPEELREWPIVTDLGHGAEFQREHPDYPAGFVTALN